VPVAGGGLAKTALRWPQGHKSQMVQWNNGPGGAALAAVTGQLGNVMQDITVQLYPKAMLTCVRLQSSVENARGAAPIPDAAMQRQYASTLADIGDAVTDCRYALNAQLLDKEDEQVTVDKHLLNRAMTKFGAASDLLYTATADIRLLHR
jgi:phosphatidate phosphatase APP1